MKICLKGGKSPCLHPVGVKRQNFVENNAENKFFLNFDPLKYDEHAYKTIPDKLEHYTDEMNPVHVPIDHICVQPRASNLPILI